MISLRSLCRLGNPTLKQSLKQSIQPSRTFITSIRPANTKQPIEQAVYRSWWSVEPYLATQSTKQSNSQPTNPSSSQAIKRFAHYGDALKQIKADGYNGIEISVQQLYRLASQGNQSHNEEQLQQVISTIKSHSLSVNLTLYSNWLDYGDWQRLTVKQHLRTLEDQILASQSLGLQPHLINAHVGCDSWSEHEHYEFFESCLRFQSLSDSPIVYETHRGRSLSNPYSTHRLCDAFPQLKLTGDLSHWIVSSERMFTHPYERQILSDCFSRMLYLHCRVASTQSPQFLVNQQTLQSKEVEHFTAMWRAVWDARRQKGDALFCWNPEIGPEPYMTNQQDVWTYTNQEKSRISSIFQQWAASTLTKEAAAAPLYSVNQTVNEPLQHSTKVEHFSPLMHEAAILGRVAIPHENEASLANAV